MSDELGWQRLHRITPFLRSWKVIVVAFAFAAHQSVQQLAHLVQQVPRGRQLVLLIAAAVLVLVVIGAWATVSWRMTRYRVVGGVLEHEVGILFRQQRRAPLDRLQAVDVVQPLLGRVFGLCELRIEVAGGSGSDVRLQYLRDSDADRLRNTLLAKAAGISYVGEEAPVAPEHPLVALPPGRLVLSLLLGWDWVVSVLVIIGAIAAAFAAPSAILTTVPVVLGVGSAMWTRFSRGFNFSAAISPDGLRLRHGLLETRTQTLPPGRVQAVELRQSLWWRRPGWWKLRVNVAGYASEGQGNAEASSTVLMPAATREEAYLLLAQIVSDLGHPDPIALLDAGCTGVTASGSFQPAPRRARWLDPIGWRRRGFAVTDTALLVRSGRITRRLIVVPHERTQSLGLQQGWLQRRFSVATVSVHSTPGPVRPVASHLDQWTAATLLDEQASRARRARRHGGPEQWMHKP